MKKWLSQWTQFMQLRKSDHFFIFISFPQFIYDLFHISLAHDFFYCDSSLKIKNASVIIYRGCPKFKTYSGFVLTCRVYDFDVFQIPYLVNAFNTQVSEKLTTTLHF